MGTIAVVHSLHLLHNEGADGSPPSYKYSTHWEGLNAVKQGLGALDIPYVLWEERNLAEPNLLASMDRAAVVVPEMRVCSEATFQRLIDLARRGWLVFSAVDSFYYDLLPNGETRRVMLRRIRELFQLPVDSDIRSRRLLQGQIEFKGTCFQWLGKGMPSGSDYSRWILAVMEGGSALASYGAIEIEQARNSAGEVDGTLQGKTVPAFLVRQYPSGGMFIYACFSLRRLENSKQILRNISAFRPEPTHGVSQRVFVVHGRDKALLQESARYLEKLELVPVVLSEQPGESQTIVEKLESCSDVQFALVLLTPDDVGGLAASEGELLLRARQNVILELGYFFGRLGRPRLAFLCDETVEIPSDFRGVEHIALDASGAWKLRLATELRRAGLDVDLNKLSE
jgi:predicted nucleotide-binding protein